MLALSFDVGDRKKWDVVGMKRTGLVGEDTDSKRALACDMHVVEVYTSLPPSLSSSLESMLWCKVSSL